MMKFQKPQKIFKDLAKFAKFRHFDNNKLYYLIKMESFLSTKENPKNAVSIDTGKVYYFNPETMVEIDQ